MKRGQRIIPENVPLIEDDAAIASGLLKLLAVEGVKITVAEDGAEAMRILEHSRPDALIVDIGLPDCDGLELFERITARFGRLPAVFSSGHADPANLGRLHSADVLMLTKPYDAETLLDALADVCAAAALHEQPPMNDSDDWNVSNDRAAK